MSELHNGTLVTTLAATDRIAAGVPGQIGAKNITVANLALQFAGGISIAKFKSQTESFDEGIAADTLLMDVYIILVSGSPSIQLTDDLGNEWLAETPITGTETVIINKHYTTEQYLFVTLTGTGSVTIVTRRILNLSV